MSKLELLSRAHDREGFDCGSEQLNCFLRQTARQHSERGISRTFVLVEENAQEPKTILGFFTLSICTVKCETLPPAEAKTLPREVGGIKLGRLAVAKELQRKGAGKILVIAAMRKFAEVFDQAGGSVCSWMRRTMPQRNITSNSVSCRCRLMNSNCFCRSRQFGWSSKISR